MSTYLDSSTFFLTPEGSCSFKHFRDGMKIKVLSHLGRWCDGTVRLIGRKPMRDFTFTNVEGHELIIRANADTKWLVFRVPSLRWKTEKKKRLVSKDKDGVPMKTILNSQTFTLNVGTKLHSLELSLFNGDEVTHRLSREEWVCGDISSDNKPADAWGIEMSEDFFFVLSNNIIVGSYSA